MRAARLIVRGAAVLAGAWWGGACGGTGGGAGDDGEAESERPSPYAESGDSTGEAPPSLSPEQVAASAMAGLRTFVTLEPDAAIEALEGMLVLEDGCPEEQETYAEGDATVVTWYTEGCTTAAGLEFSGGGRLERFTAADGTSTSEGATVSSEGGSLRLGTADGRFIALNGYVYYERGSTEEGSESYFEVVGQLSADPETAAVSPMLDERLRAQGGLYSYAGGGYEVLGGQGSLGAAALVDGALAFQFSDFLVAPSECGLEPLGTVSVRDEAGYWHDIAFDAGTIVDEEPMFDEALCDGCGTYVVAGRIEGQACVAEADVLALLAWEGLPW
jgi:hypothetical protein